MSPNHLKNLFDLADTLQAATHEYFANAGYKYIDVPQIVGITGACENVDTLFQVGSRVPVALYFSQTGQLSLEQALQYFDKVYTIIQSGRDEEAEDARHLRQFRLTEEEFDWSSEFDARDYDEETLYEALLQHIEKLVKHVTRQVVSTHASLLHDEYGRDITAVLESLTFPFWRVSYDDAVVMLRKNGFPELSWGDDLKTEHEALVVRLMNASQETKAMNVSSRPSAELPVFIMRYPKDIKFFNMQVSAPDPRVVLSADLVFPYAGEGVGSAVREHNGDKLKQRLLDSTMFRLHQARGGTYDDFIWYVEDLVNAGKTQPHAGYGMGNDRLMQYILGARDIRECSVLALMTRETGDWELRNTTDAYVPESELLVS